MSYRRVAVIGSLLSTTSLLYVPFLDNIIYLYIIYGIFTGLGFAMVYLPSSVLAGLYFNKHRSLAAGVAASGSGVGAVVFPLSVHSLIQYYGWKGSVFILAGLSLHCIVFSALLFPLAEKPDRKEQKSVLAIINILDKQTNNPDIHHMRINVGILLMLLPFKIFQSVEILSLIMFLNGLGFEGILGLLVIFTVDLLGEKALGDGFGYLMLSNGVGSIIGPPLGGAFKDSLGTCDPTFFFAGTVIVVAGLLMFLIPIRDKFVLRPKKITIELTIEVNLNT
ncbi:Hypothetical predicted protein [Mytilus galloprovincialis]|uniref:Major facilitator superfamily (MFS) profile domain-containing protein n=1 Tax=Mytilus galloprovincialis TaxID=29158 RepID=A0A8B6HMV8_MYTGA|nr:Hypothetical predicted protein [Mytilus galloprovincialis]